MEFRRRGVPRNDGAMGAFMEKRRAEDARDQEDFEEEQRKYWTPPKLLEGCCVQWLGHGPELPSHHSYVSARGCSGGCLKAHPRITLAIEGGYSCAKISHELDPFIRYFENDLPGTTKPSPLNYRLPGFLSDHLETLKAKFGSHLIKVSPQALSASERAQQRHLEHEELERRAKRRKLSGNYVGSNLLEIVLEICYNHSLRDHLDIADVAWMRLSCKAMGRIAARLARERMQQVRLTHSVLLDGRSISSIAPDLPKEGFLITTECRQYKVAVAHQPLQQRAGCFSEFQPQTQTQVEFDSGVISKDGTPQVDTSNPGYIEVPIRPQGYHGHCIRFYLDWKQSERDVFSNNNNNRLEVARHRIDPKDMLEGTQTSTRVASRAAYEVTSARMETSPNGVMRFKGSFFVKSITFTFGDLMGIYVRKKLPMAKSKYLASQNKKPWKKQYVKALAKAVREAPGSADEFLGMAGWS